LALEPFRRFLLRHRRIALDTNIFIYWLEESPRYLAITDLVFSRIEEPNCEAVTSIITMTELFVPAYREGNKLRVSAYHGILTTYVNLQWITVDLPIADLAAQLRAENKLQTPDAIQAATALLSGATGLVTNDPAFTRVEGIETAVLDRYL
jgi:predicted nucleic acid-binding protein